MHAPLCLKSVCVCDLAVDEFNVAVQDEIQCRINYEGVGEDRVDIVCEWVSEVDCVSMTV